jgi:putative PEP-CTERM system TPR-repeat lipoprotein
LANARINVEDIAGGTESLKKALQLKPDYAEAVYALAGLNVRASQFDEAVKLARQLQALTPQSPAGFVIEGDVLTAQKRYTEAVKAYEKAIAIGGAGPIVVKLHAAETKAGNPREADAKLQQWLKEHPEDMSVLRYLAAENLKAGRNKLAIEQYEVVLKKLPNDLSSLNNLAYLYQQEKDPRALKMAEQAYKLMPDSATISDTLGWILVEQGKTKRGLELLQKAAAKLPKNTEVRYHLAVALAKSGDKAKARKELEMLLASEQAFPRREAAQLLLKQL